MTTPLIQDDVCAALADHRAVVALETAVTTAGLPRSPADPPSLADPACARALASWDAQSPVNLETARAMSRMVQSQGATPAVIAVLHGRLRIGLDDAQLEALAGDPTAGKCSATDLAAAMTRGQTAGTTVSATLSACRQTNPPLRVFATGGIGGVHRKWIDHPDISADLVALSRTPVCIVCSGAKSLLDLPATVEALETLGVPVIGSGIDRFPQFVAGVRQDLPLRHQTDDVASIARICRTHWQDLQQPSAVLVVQPSPIAIDADEMERAVERAEAEATKQDQRGADRTPFVLEHVARQTSGRSLMANIALLLNNARLAGAIACAWATLDT